MTQNHLELTDRIDKLERENRRMRRVGGSLLAGLGLVTLMSMAAPMVCKTVWGERFVLRDSNGRERMVLNAYSTRTPSMVFKSTDGQPLARLNVGDEDVSIQLFKDGVPTAASFKLSPQATDHSQCTGKSVTDDDRNIN